MEILGHYDDGGPVIGKTQKDEGIVTPKVACQMDFLATLPCFEMGTIYSVHLVLFEGRWNTEPIGKLFFETTDSEGNSIYYVLTGSAEIYGADGELLDDVFTFPETETEYYIVLKDFELSKDVGKAKNACEGFSPTPKHG